MATEKRLIDANALIKDWNELTKRMVRDADGKIPVDFGLVIRELSKTPTVDAVEVVRCKDCKYWRDYWVAPDGKSKHGECDMENADGVIVGRWDDDYCSYGERKYND